MFHFTGGLGRIKVTVASLYSALATLRILETKKNSMEQKYSKMNWKSVDKLAEVAITKLQKRLSVIAVF